MSVLGTPSRTDETNTTAFQLATLAQLWLHLPADLRAAILLMVQPWATSGLNMPHAANVAQSADDSQSHLSVIDHDERSTPVIVRAEQ